jgi:immune inhibitor A
MKSFRVDLLKLIAVFCIITVYISSYTIRLAEARAKSTGTLKVLVLMADFSDKVGQVQSIYFNDLMFGSHPSVAPLGSFSDYYTEVSYGQFTITGQINDGVTNWYRMPQTYSYYVNNQKGLGEYPQNTVRLVEDAVATARTAGLNFGPFDNDNDGYVDAIFIVHAGQGSQFTNCTCDIQSHYLPFDDRKAIDIDTGSVNGRGNKIYIRDYPETCVI